MADKLMPKKVIINPFISLTSPSLSALKELSIETFGFEDVIDWDGDMKGRNFANHLKLFAIL